MASLIDWSSYWPCYSCCHRLWIPALGTFGPHCIGIVSHVPTWIALSITVLRHGLGPVWRRRPIWLKSFAVEDARAPVEVEDVGISTSRPCQWTRIVTCLFVLSLVGLCIGVYGLFVARLGPVHSVLVVPCIVSCLLLAVERPASTPGALLIIHSSLLLVQLLLVLAVPQLVKGSTGGVWLSEMSIPLISLTFILNMPMRDPWLTSIGISQPFSTPTSSLRSPEDDFTLWQWLTISWMAPLISVGHKRQLNEEDVWFLPYEFQHTRLHLLFREIKGSVIGRLVKANGPDLFITAGLGIFQSATELIQVVLLKQLLSALQKESPEIWVAIVYATMTLFARWSAAQSAVLSLWFSRRCYERARGEMIAMIYEKTLQRKAFTFPSGHPMEKVLEDDADSSMYTPATGTSLDEELDDTDDIYTAKLAKLSLLQRLASPFRRGYSKLDPKPLRTTTPAPADTPASTGKILNLMRNDVYEVAQRFWEFPSIITKPLNLILSLFLLWQFLGPSSLLGVILLLIGQLINAFVIRVLLRVERVRRTITDLKLQLTSQFVESIRHLRWYDWQDKWLKQILESRQAELNKRVITSLLSKAISTVNNLCALLLPVIGFLGYTLLAGGSLTVDIAFPALDLFGLLQTSLRELPDLITVLLNAKIAMDRIESFMAEPDKHVDSSESTGLPSSVDEPHIEFRAASFSWPGSRRKVLQQVYLSCRAGLTVVCGKVGMGKTALLQAILGELDQVDGECCVPKEMIAYCTQLPWLQSMSIRENILFCADYDERRYRQVLDACCLIPDLGNFKAGDLSMVGENGVGLSGGQKARVALARALYSRSRVLMLDDPIAALDHQTAETILRKLFTNRSSPLVDGRLIVFVTHRVDIVIPYADKVLDVVEGGRVVTIGKQDLDTNEELRHLAAGAITQHDVLEDENPSQENTAIPDKFIEEEYRAEGGVMASVYWRYVKAGRLKWWAATIACFIAFRISRIAYLWFLKQWGEGYRTMPTSLQLSNTDTLPHTQIELSQTAFRSSTRQHKSSWLDIDLGLPDPSSNVNPWLFWFLILSIAQVLAQALSEFVIVIIVYKAGKRLFTDVMRRVGNANFRFYDVTPVGRLMNRLTSDIGTMDGQIANQLMLVAWFSIDWLSSVVVIAAATPLFLALTFLMTALFVYVFMRFLPCSQSLRRLEMTSLSPLMSNFGTLLDGLVTVRAFRAEPHFQSRLIATTDNFQKMDHFYWSLQSWLMYRFDNLSAISSFALTLTALGTGMSSGAVAFILAAAGNFVNSTHQLCRKYGELQMQFVSVERVIELLDLDQEPIGDVHPPSAWPTYTDDIIFENVTLRYAANLEPSLRGLSFRIPAGSTVAVTGRTGSGKSTLALSLLGTILPDVENGGSITIGGIDIARADKHALRRAISFVAQDPVLFPGTLRDNLDPLHEHGDNECSSVLESVLGKEAAAGGELSIDSRVDGGGKNLSQGQRQLVGLGRAVLRRSPIVILDEATASVDFKTAFNIQEVLRQELKQSTVITIAHRIEAVRDANYKIILDKGQVVECGPIG